MDKKQLIQLALAIVLFLGIGVWYFHSPMHHDKQAIAREAMICQIVSYDSFIFTQPGEVVNEYQGYRHSIMEKYDISEEDLQNDSESRLSKGGQIIRANSIVRWLLGYDYEVKNPVSYPKARRELNRQGLPVRKWLGID